MNFSRIHIIIPIAFLFANLGCTSSVSGHQELIGLNKTENAANELILYHNMRIRLDRVSARVLQSNASLCGVTGRDLGVITHTLASYPRKLRQSAATILGATSSPVILYVRKDGPATLLEVGDVLIGKNSNPVDHLHEDVQAYLAAGVIKVRRAEHELIFPISAPQACAYNVRLRMRNSVNAHASGGQIIIDKALIDFVENDDELAMVIGHELAHSTGKHLGKAVRSGGLFGLAKNLMHKLEVEADYVGLYYMARAGYNPSKAELFWQRMGDKKSENTPQNIFRSSTHQVTKTRIDFIREGVSEIANKRVDKRPLIPN